ncbi:hypothetical protein BOX15_Mlig011786g1 [Macrostomum lignano]|uniref:SHSP domain-containing protein n=1 Tax=Macrostomum lignano TaxID=282301 RepID=A0A267EWF9_9PLAT|nr:hypothetical protein BOX15_Mlig011786g1 [Macrostomum lignano]
MSGGNASPMQGRSPSPRLSPRIVEDLRRASPVWDEEFDKLTRSMQERMDGFFRTPGQVDPGCSDSGRTGRIERQPDGSLVYRVVFDVRDYEPGDLKTSLVGDRTVRVCGNSKRVDPRTGKQSSASFDEQFSLPDGVDPRGVRSTVAEGQLSVTAPVMPPQYSGKQPALQQQSRLYSNSPRLSPRSGSPAFSQPLGSPRHQQQQQGSGVRTASAFQLEVDVGPEFEPQDLTVATVDNGRRLSVHGRREVKSAGKTSMREFRDEFDLPANVDARLVTARLRSDGRVIVDMPLLRETAGFTYAPVAVDHR